MLSRIVKDLEAQGIKVLDRLAFGKYLVLRAISTEGTELTLRIPKPCINDPDKYSCRDSTRDLYMEYESRARINSDRIVEYMDIVEIRGVPIAIREYVSTTLRNLISREALSMTRALAIAREVALALRDIHRAGYVYTDLKPENIGFRNGTVKLIDLDALTKPFSRPRFITFDYAPPEYLTNGIVVYESDVYQLALVIHEMVFKELRNPALGHSFRDLGDERVSRLLKSMTLKVPFARPSIDKVVIDIEVMLKDLV